MKSDLTLAFFYADEPSAERGLAAIERRLAAGGPPGAPARCVRGPLLVGIVCEGVARHSDLEERAGLAAALVDRFRSLWSASGAFVAHVALEWRPGQHNRACVVDLGPDPALARPRWPPVATDGSEERLRRFDPSAATIDGFNLANAYSAALVERFGRGRLLAEATAHGCRIEEAPEGDVLLVGPVLAAAAAHDRRDPRV